jgi:beta-N-acetylhexosaminidase
VTIPLASRVGEHFVLGFRGTALPDWLLEFEREFGLGGILLFDRDVESGGDLRNVESGPQVAALCAAVHALDSRPLVFVDQEGGRVRRLKPARGFAELPSAAEFARLEDSHARAVASESYRQMRECGIDFNLAPVVDLNSNPENPNIGALERSFSPEPAEVRRCVRILAVVARESGVQLCLKHYPGLGGARVDSHREPTDVTGTNSPDQEALFVELQSEVPGSAILLSHAIDRARDPDWPASVSDAVVGELRRACPEALLITDDVQMEGLRRFCDTPEAAVRAASAGVDWVCIGNNLAREEAECVAAARRLRHEAARDRRLETRLSESRARIRAAKRRARAAGVTSEVEPASFSRRPDPR